MPGAACFRYNVAISRIAPAQQCISLSTKHPASFQTKCFCTDSRFSWCPAKSRFHWSEDILVWCISHALANRIHKAGRGTTHRPQVFGQDSWGSMPHGRIVLACRWLIGCPKLCRFEQQSRWASLGGIRPTCVINVLIGAQFRLILSDSVTQNKCCWKSSAERFWSHLRA